MVYAFAQAIRESAFSKGNQKHLVERTVSATISHVAQAFRDNQFPDPRLDEDGKPSRLLSRLYTGYSKKDPPTKQQKALPVCVLREMERNKSTNRAKAVGELAIGAYFFAMRSCEYLTVSGERLTKRLKIRNIRFFRHGREILHNDPTLSASDYVSITFEDQKNGERFDTITMHCAYDLLLCPVVAWAKIVQRILKCPGTSSDSFVNTFYSSGNLYHVSGDDMLSSLQAAANAIGESRLGFHPNDIGTHSIRSGAAMGMYLAEVPVYTIMLIGRWSSDAFLRYIRKQVEQFSHNVSRRMIQHQHFTHVPNFLPQTSRHDPRQRNHRDNAQTRQNMGRAGARVQAALPRMAMWT